MRSLFDKGEVVKKYFIILSFCMGIIFIAGAQDPSLYGTGYLINDTGQSVQVRFIWGDWPLDAKGATVMTLAPGGSYPFKEQTFKPKLYNQFEVQYTFKEPSFSGKSMVTQSFHWGPNTVHAKEDVVHLTQSGVTLEKKGAVK